MKTSEIQQLILEQTGIKTSVKKLTGSMKTHTRFGSMFQNGTYPKFGYDWRKQFTTTIGRGNFAGDYEIDIHNYNIQFDEPIKFKKERKPTPVSEMKVKQWGSKNSQLRLDKATARNAKRLMAGTTARYC